MKEENKGFSSLKDTPLGFKSVICGYKRHDEGLER